MSNDTFKKDIAILISSGRVTLKPHFEKGCSLTACRICCYFGIEKGSFIIDEMEGMICESCVLDINSKIEQPQENTDHIFESITKPLQYQLTDDFNIPDLSTYTSAVSLPCGGMFYS